MSFCLVHRIAAVAALGLVAHTAHAQNSGIALGAHAPAALVQSLDAKPVALSEYVGKGPVVLEFWATWCPNCRELMPALDAARKKYAGKVRFVTVAVAINESPERVRRYVAAHGMTDVVYDAEGSASEAYDVPATSYVVVLDRTGKVVYTGLGGSQNIDAAVQKAL